MSWSAGSGRGGTVCPPAGFPPDPCRTVGAVINRPGDSAGVPAGQCAPHSLFGCAKKRTRRARCKRKRRRARSGAVALRAYGGRRTSACSDFSWHSGTLGPSVRSILPSRGGWCGSCRGARTHLTSFSFRAFRFATRYPGGRRGLCFRADVHIRPLHQFLRGTASGSEKRSRDNAITTPTTSAPSATGRQLQTCRREKRARRQAKIGACTDPPTPVARRRERAGARLSGLFFWTVHGPFSFPQEGKENGGCIPLDQPPVGAESPVAAGRRPIPCYPRTSLRPSR